ncbi:MAG: adenylate/guanylate cyclase domain-containing protein [Alphaproteobacteria bacterium]
MDKRAAWVVVRRARLVSGLVLFAYVTTHFLNHTLGLLSLDAAEDGRVWFLAFWRSGAGTAALYGALATHLLLALWSLYRRRSLRMPVWEAAQLALGLAIPPLLFEHVIGTRFLHEFAGVEDSYTYVALVIWDFYPAKGVQQILTLAIAWLHGCIGLHFWLRLKPGYRRAVPLAFAAALLLPVLASLGFVEAGRMASALAKQPGWLADAEAVIKFPNDAAIAAATRRLDIMLWTYGALLGATLAARVLRAQWQRRHGRVRLTYPGGTVVEIERGMTVLEASRNAGIPHASVCGGRGRCSTCRIRLGLGAEVAPPADEGEARVLARIAAPPNVRLACQLRPRADLAVMPLLPPAAGPARAASAAPHERGEEKEIAILFADLRGFTRLAEGRLPYDTVFVLNRYFESMGRAVEENGGLVDKFIGDGVMALFGVKDGPESGCRNALAAARAMAGRLAELNASLAHELDTPLRIGIGIHAGPAIVGEMGYARATTLTAVGDAVNTSSRLESLTKEYGVELVLSDHVAKRAGVELGAFETREAEIRGRREPLAIRLVPNAAELPVGT